jgi:uncharacterized protein (DUF2141 family)
MWFSALTADTRRAWLRRVTLLLTALSLVSASTALAGDVRGALTVPTDLASMVPPPAEAAVARSRYWEEWNGFIEARPRRIEVAREIAVVLTGGPASTGEQPPYRIHNGSLFPSTIVARAGTGIQIRNDDGTAYELFAEGLADFAAIQTAPGNARPVTVGAEGNWAIRDRLHPHVVGHLHAIPDLVSRAFVEPSGAFVFRGVEPGSYTLRAFHGAREIMTPTPVTVGDARELVVPAIAVSAAAAAPAGAAAPPAAPAAPAATP